MSTTQEDFWKGEFGKTYTERNANTQEDWDAIYQKIWGITKIEMNRKLIGTFPKDIKILEVGCNIGMQLICFKRMGFTNLYGIELQEYAIEKAKSTTQGINIIQGTGFDLPFKDNYFDLVCTNGVLIHIAPENHVPFMREMVRCSKKYIMGHEYFAKETTEIPYRGNNNCMWKANFAHIFAANFPQLKIAQEEFYTYLDTPSQTDTMYLLEKR